MSKIHNVIIKPVMPTKAEVETYLATNRVQEAIQEAITAVVKEGMPTDALRAIGEKQGG